MVENLFLYANNGQAKAHSGRELSPKVTEGEGGIMESVLFYPHEEVGLPFTLRFFWSEMWYIKDLP